MLKTRSKKVEACADDGTVVYRFDSIGEAARFIGRSRTAITYGIQYPQRMCSGFFWREIKPANRKTWNRMRQYLNELEQIKTAETHDYYVEPDLAIVKVNWKSHRLDRPSTPRLKVAIAQEITRVQNWLNLYI